MWPALAEPRSMWPALAEPRSPVPRARCARPGWACQIPDRQRERTCRLRATIDIETRYAGGAGAVKDAGPRAGTALRSSRLWRSGRGRQADEVETVHACIADPDRPVEVRSGHAPGRADEPDDFPRVDDAPGSHPRLAEVAVEAEEPEPMVEDDRTAGEEEVLVQYDPSTLHGMNDGPGRRAEVHAA